MEGGHRKGGDESVRWQVSMRSGARFVFALTVVLVAACANRGLSGSGVPGTAPSFVGQAQVSSQTCALASADGRNFVLVRGSTAGDDCRVLLADFASSTVQSWHASMAQLPPSTADTLFCDLIAQTGNRVDVWGSSLQTVGSSICSQLQTGIIPAEVAPPTPTPVPTICSFEYDYEAAHATVIIVRGADAADACRGLSGKLPAGNWQLLMKEAYSAYRICQGTIGSSSIEVWDMVLSGLPTWTTEICAQIEAGTLGR